MSLPKFPRDLDEMHAAAEADLTKPQQGVRLKWTFWHGQALGSIEAARAALAHASNIDRDARMQVLYHVLQPELAKAAMEKAPTAVEMRQLRDLLVLAVAMADIAERVIGLLATRPAQVAEGGQLRTAPAPQQRRAG